MPPHSPYRPTANIQRGAAHVRARKRGVAVIVESGRAADPLHHFRLRRDTVHLWRLDMATHTGRWQPTPFRDQLDALVTMVVDSFPLDAHPIETRNELPLRSSS